MQDPAETYVIDEPTTGLHLADVSRLLTVLDALVDQGSTVVVIEHDMRVVAHADWIIDLGPGAGRRGGRILFEGTPGDLAKDKHSITGQHLRRQLAGSGRTRSRKTGHR